MSEIQSPSVPSGKKTRRLSVFFVGDETVSIFRNQPASFQNTSGQIGVFSFVKSTEGMEGIESVDDNHVVVHVAADSDVNAFRDLIEVRNSVGPYLDPLRDMILASGVNIIVSTLGDSFSSGVTPEIAQLSAGLDAVTIAVLTLPHPDEGNKYLQHSRFALEYTKPHCDAMIILPMENIYRVYSDTTMTQHMGEKIAMMVARITRGVIDGITSQGFNHQSRTEDLAAFFQNAGELLVSYQEIEEVPNGPYHAILRCLQEPFHALRRFDGAQNILVSVCSGEAGIPVDSYLRIGQLCRNELGKETDILVRPFPSPIRGERAFVVVFGRDIKEKRPDGFDFPYAEVPPEKAPSRLPAYYRKYYGQKGRAIHYDISSF